MTLALPQTGTRPSRTIDDALRAVREHLDMPIAFVSEFVDGMIVFRNVNAPDHGHVIKTGDSFSNEDAYCNHIREGRLPQLMPDTAAVEFTKTLAITDTAPIGSHISVPIERADGSIYGMFCCLSPVASPTLNERDLNVMRMFAGLAADQIDLAHADVFALDALRDQIGGVLTERAFRMVFQPIVSIDTGMPVAHEALCRFTPLPYRPPNLWFDDAATVGLLAPLECAAIRAALAALPLMPPSTYLSVNASPLTILTGDVLDCLRDIDFARVVVEVTEHSHFGDLNDLKYQVDRLRETGVRIAIDDVGAGYSGLQQIANLAPDILKMDISLTRSCDTDATRQSVVRSIVALADNIGARVVAEGIETPSEAQALADFGVTLGQGWHYSKPLEVADFGTTAPDGSVAGAGTREPRHPGIPQPFEVGTRMVG